MLKFAWRPCRDLCRLLSKAAGAHYFVTWPGTAIAAGWWRWRRRRTSFGQRNFTGTSSLAQPPSPSHFRFGFHSNNRLLCKSVEKSLHMLIHIIVFCYTLMIMFHFVAFTLKRTTKLYQQHTGISGGALQLVTWKRVRVSLIIGFCFH